MTMFARLGKGALALCLAMTPFAVSAQTKIEFFFPVPVEGKLAREMTRLVKLYNESQTEVEVTAVLYRRLRRHKAHRLRPPPRPASRPPSC